VREGREAQHLLSTGLGWLRRVPLRSYWLEGRHMRHRGTLDQMAVGRLRGGASGMKAITRLAATWRPGQARTGTMHARTTPREGSRQCAIQFGIPECRLSKPRLGRGTLLILASTWNLAPRDDVHRPFQTRTAHRQTSELAPISPPPSWCSTMELAIFPTIYYAVLQCCNLSFFRQRS
jgi:hypothetical protein